MSYSEVIAPLGLMVKQLLTTILSPIAAIALVVGLGVTVGPVAAGAALVGLFFLWPVFVGIISIPIGLAVWVLHMLAVIALIIVSLIKR